MRMMTTIMPTTALTLCRKPAKLLELKLIHQGMMTIIRFLNRKKSTAVASSTDYVKKTSNLLTNTK